jgi:hypothetical protein
LFSNSASQNWQSHPRSCVIWWNAAWDGTRGWGAGEIESLLSAIFVCLFCIPNSAGPGTPLKKDQLCRSLGQPCQITDLIRWGLFIFIFVFMGHFTLIEMSFRGDGVKAQKANGYWFSANHMAPCTIIQSFKFPGLR